MDFVLFYLSIFESQSLQINLNCVNFLFLLRQNKFVYFSLYTKYLKKSQRNPNSNQTMDFTRRYDE